MGHEPLAAVVAAASDQRPAGHYPPADTRPAMTTHRIRHARVRAVWFGWGDSCQDEPVGEDISSATNTAGERFIAISRNGVCVKWAARRNQGSIDWVGQSWEEEGKGARGSGREGLGKGFFEWRKGERKEVSLNKKGEGGGVGGVGPKAVCIHACLGGQ